MPTYQYACTACGERSEAVQSFTDAPLTECAACGGALRKVFSAVGVVFKGSGFYKTDSRAPAKSGGGDGKGSETKADSAGSGTSDSTGSSSTSSGSGSDKGASGGTTPAAGSSTSSTSSTPASKTA